MEAVPINIKQIEASYNIVEDSKEIMPQKIYKVTSINTLVALDNNTVYDKIANMPKGPVQHSEMDTFHLDLKFISWIWSAGVVLIILYIVYINIALSLHSDITLHIIYGVYMFDKKYEEDSYGTI